jgi:regulatory protein
VAAFSQELCARALRLLARREHSRSELERKLAPHAESQQALRALLDVLVEKKQLSDARYAAERARQLQRKYGAAMVRQKLGQAGVGKDVVLAAVTATDERERARAILRRRFRDEPRTREERAKRARFLAGRGFSYDVIRRALGGQDEPVEA